MKKLFKEPMKKSHIRCPGCKKFLRRLPLFLNSFFIKKQKGFTLIELVVVMAIIAILATAGLAGYTSYIKGARDSARITIAHQLQTIIEALTTVSGAPTSTQVAEYLTSEGIAWKIPSENPLLVHVAESVIGVLGIPDALALVKDPVGGKAVCLNYYGEAVMVCQFVYYKFSDGTYAISYGVEKSSNLVNPHYSQTTGLRTYGSFIGNSSTITLPPNAQNIENLLVDITIESSGAMSVISTDATNGSSEHEIPAGGSCSSDNDCASSVCGGNPKSCHAIGSAGSGEECTQNSDCVSGYCSGSFCSTGVTGEGSCRSNDACASGYCDGNNRCSNGETYVDTCNSNDACASTYCSYDNYCSLGASGDSALDQGSCQPGIKNITMWDMCTDGALDQPCDDDTSCISGLICSQESKQFNPYPNAPYRLAPYCTYSPPPELKYPEGNPYGTMGCPRTSGDTTWCQGGVCAFVGVGGNGLIQGQSACTGGKLRSNDPTFWCEDDDQCASGTCSSSPWPPHCL